MVIKNVLVLWKSKISAVFTGSRKWSGSHWIQNVVTVHESGRNHGCEFPSQLFED